MRKSLVEVFHESGLFKAKNPIDTITLDIPLFIRLLEYAREDAKTDMDLHDISEKITRICSQGNVATMRHYNRIVG